MIADKNTVGAKAQRSDTERLLPASPKPGAKAEIKKDPAEKKTTRHAAMLNVRRFRVALANLQALTGADLNNALKPGTNVPCRVVDSKVGKKKAMEKLRRKESNSWPAPNVLATTASLIIAMRVTATVAHAIAKKDRTIKDLGFPNGFWITLIACCP